MRERRDRLRVQTTSLNPYYTGSYSMRTKKRVFV